MATFRDALLPTISAVRAIAGQLGIRLHTVAIVTGAWSGDHTGDGVETQAATPITESGGHPPKVRWLNDEQITVGNLPRGTVEIGPITPAFTGGGTELGMLTAEAIQRGDTVHVRITGPNHPDGAMYRVTDVQSHRAFRYMIQAQPVSSI